MSRKPFVYWAQDKNFVYLKFQVANCEKNNVKIDCDEDTLRFSAIGVGAHSIETEYRIEEFLYDEIIHENISEVISQSNVRLTLPKRPQLRRRDKHDDEVCAAGWWPRLFRDAQKREWLKIDFERWKEPEESDSADDQENGGVSFIDPKKSEGEQMRQLLKQLESSNKHRSSKRIIDDAMRTKLLLSYLTLYNVVMTFGYLFVLVELIVGYFNHRDEYHFLAWSSIAPKMRYLLTLHSFELAHCYLGWSRTETFSIVFYQVFSRFFITVVLANSEERLHFKVITVCFFAFYSIESLFYFLNGILAVNRRSNRLLEFFKHTLWLITIPALFFLEATFCLIALPFFIESRRFSCLMPNRANMSFDFPIIILAYLLIYTPIATFYSVSHKRRERAKHIRQGALERAKKAY